MSKKILFSILMIAVVAGLIGAATWASYSDTAPAALNGEATSLYFDRVSVLDYAMGDVSPGWHTFKGLGDTNPDASPWVIILKNAGTIPGTVSMDITDYDNDENGVVAPEAAAGDSGPLGELPDNTIVTIYKDGTSFGPAPGTVVFGPDTVANLEAAAPLALGTFAAGEQHAYAWKIEVPSSTGNLIQSDKLGFKASYTIAQ